MLMRDEATAACRNVRNLWPRSESEALRYRRQVARRETINAEWFVEKGIEPIVTASGSTIAACAINHDYYRQINLYPSLAGEGFAIRTDGDVPDGYALVEWLAPDGRCADHGDVERHGEHLVRQADGGSWFCHDESQRVRVGHYHIDTASGIVPVGEYRFPQCRQADRFRGHEGDPWCGERFEPTVQGSHYGRPVPQTKLRLMEIGEGVGYRVSITRERLTAEHPDHARHEAELFGPGEGNLIGGVVVYPNHPPRSQR